MPKSPSETKFLKTHRSLVTSTRGMSTGMMLGSSFALATGFLGWLGHQGDLRWGTEPWLAVGGVLLGFLYGGVEVWKLARPAPEEKPHPDGE